MYSAKRKRKKKKEKRTNFTQGQLNLNSKPRSTRKKVMGRQVSK
jgi:hypothetical protein